MLLAFMALCRIRSIEDLRYTAPGEWGKLLGLDRCPEAKTLREKLKILTSGNPEEGSAQLCEDWMEADAANVGTLYIDGHSRVYHGHQTKLPRHYVARQRLCLRATSDYWVNMEQAEALREEIERETTELERLKSQRKETGKHVNYGDLPEEEQFLKLATRSKHFIDTLKIIAYRAETAMARVVREHLGKHHEDEARACVRDLYTTEANLIPDLEAKTLTVELHSMATPKANKIMCHLCAELNATETEYPDTELKLIFKSVSE
jgi:hypothetical protein